MNQGRERYEAVRRKYPALFANPPGAVYEILFDTSQVNAAKPRTRPAWRPAACRPPGRQPVLSTRTRTRSCSRCRAASRREPQHVLQTLPASGASGPRSFRCLTGRSCSCVYFCTPRVGALVDSPRFRRACSDRSRSGSRRTPREIQAEADRLIALAAYILIPGRERPRAVPRYYSRFLTAGSGGDYRHRAAATRSSRKTSRRRNYHSFTIGLHPHAACLLDFDAFRPPSPSRCARSPRPPPRQRHPAGGSPCGGSARRRTPRRRGPGPRSRRAGRSCPRRNST